MKHLLRTAVCILSAIGLVLSLAACGKGNESQSVPVQTKAAVGESLSTLFFDVIVNKAERVDSYEDYTAQGDEQLIVANVTVTNTTDAPITMFDSDFKMAWGAGEGAFAWVFDAFADTMQPAQDTLNAGESRTYDLLYPVPSDQKNLALCYTEIYQDETEEIINGLDFRVEFAI